jgi:HEAT repeat protein
MFTMEESIPVKLSILNELYYIRDPSVLAHVVAALSSNQPLDVRDEAISVLEDMGDQRAIASLWSLLTDPDDNIRENAQKAIDAITARTVSTAR